MKKWKAIVNNLWSMCLVYLRWVRYLYMCLHQKKEFIMVTSACTTMVVVSIGVHPNRRRGGRVGDTSVNPCLATSLVDLLIMFPPYVNYVFNIWNIINNKMHKRRKVYLTQIDQERTRRQYFIHGPTKRSKHTHFVSKTDDPDEDALSFCICIVF
jgi:hypothetical protein